MGRTTLEEQRRLGDVHCYDLMRRLDAYETGACTPTWVLEVRREIVAEMLEEWADSAYRLSEQLRLLGLR